MTKRKRGSSQATAFLESIDQLFNEQHSSGHRTPGDFRSVRNQIIGLLDDCNGMSVSKAFASHDFRLGNGKAPATKAARPPSWVKLSQQEKRKLTKTGKAPSFVKSLRNMLIRQEKAHQKRVDALFESGGESEGPTPKRRKKKQLDGEREYQPSPGNKANMQSSLSYVHSPPPQKRKSVQKNDETTGSASRDQKEDSTVRKRIKLSVKAGWNEDEDKKMRKPGTVHKAKPTVFGQVKVGSQRNPDMDFSSLSSPFDPSPGTYLWGEPRQSYSVGSQMTDQSLSKSQSFKAHTRGQPENPALKSLETTISDTSSSQQPKKRNGGVAPRTPVNASSGPLRDQRHAELPQKTAALYSPARKDEADDTNVNSNHEDVSVNEEHDDFGQRYSSLESDDADTDTDTDSDSDSPPRSSMRDKGRPVLSFQSTGCESKIWPSARQHTLPLRQIINSPLQRLRTSLQIYKCHYEHIEPRLWKRYVKKLESFVQEPKFRQKSFEQRLGRFRKIVHCDEELAAMPTEDWERTRRAARLCGWLVEITTARGEDAKAWAERKTLACIRDIDCLERTIGTKNKEREGQKNDRRKGNAMEGVEDSIKGPATGAHQLAGDEQVKKTDALERVEN